MDQGLEPESDPTQASGLSSSSAPHLQDLQQEVEAVPATDLATDVHPIPVSHTGDVAATLTWEVGALDLELRDQDGQPVDIGEGIVGEKTLSYPVPDGEFGTYTLHVTNPVPLAPGVAYELTGSSPVYADLDLRLQRLPAGTSTWMQVDASATQDRPETISYSVPGTQVGDAFRFQIVSTDHQAQWTLDWTWPVASMASVRMRLVDPGGDPVAEPVSGATGHLELATDVPEAGEYALEVTNLTDHTDVPSYAISARAPAGIVADLDLALYKHKDDEGCTGLIATLNEECWDLVTAASDSEVPAESLEHTVQAGDEGTYGFKVTSKDHPAIWHLDHEAPSVEWAETAYDAAGRVIATTTPDGTTTSEYDERGLLVTETLPAPDADSDPVVREHEYDANGNQVATTDERGHRWVSVYDALGRVIATRDPACDATPPDPDCAQTTTSYDLAARTVTVTDPHGTTATTTREHNAHGEVVEETAPHDENTDAVSTFDYDDGGRLEAVHGPRTDVADLTAYAYDPEGRLIEVIQHLGHEEDPEAPDPLTTTFG